MNSLDPYVEYEKPRIGSKKSRELDNLNASNLGLWAGCKKILAENGSLFSSDKKKIANLIKKGDLE